MSRDLGDSESGLGLRARGQLTNRLFILDGEKILSLESGRPTDQPKLNFATAVRKCISFPHKEKEEETSERRRRLSTYLSDFFA